MDAIVGAIATVLVALISLIGVSLETTRRTIKGIGEANVTEHESTTLLLKTVVRDVGGLRADIRELNNRFNDHVDEGWRRGK